MSNDIHHIAFPRNFCHSEQKLIHFLNDRWQAIEDFIREFSQGKQILNVSLNIHSTRSFCENCGLSLLIATYGDGGFAHRVSNLLGIRPTQFTITGSFRYWHEPKEAESPIQADRFNFMNLQEEIIDQFRGFGFLARGIGLPPPKADDPSSSAENNEKRSRSPITEEEDARPKGLSSSGATAARRSRSPSPTTDEDKEE